MLRLLRYIPRHCLLCHCTSNTGKDVCETCINTLPFIQTACIRCGIPLPQAQLCGTCIQKSPSYERSIICFTYDDPIDRWVSQLKFNHQLIHAQILGECLYDKLKLHYTKENLPEVIVPVPLHSKRLKKRGFNQAIEIARPIAKHLKLPLARNLIKREKNTSPQSDLPTKQRKKNMRGAFACKKKLPYQHVALIDDVITTGNTIDACCIALKKAGVKKIDLWCCAKTLLSRKSQ